MRFAATRMFPVWNPVRKDSRSDPVHHHGGVSIGSEYRLAMGREHFWAARAHWEGRAEELERECNQLEISRIARTQACQQPRPAVVQNIRDERGIAVR